MELHNRHCIVMYANARSHARLIRSSWVARQHRRLLSAQYWVRLLRKVLGQYQYHPIPASIAQYPVPQYRYRSNPSANLYCIWEVTPNVNFSQNLIAVCLENHLLLPLPINVKCLCMSEDKVYCIFTAQCHASVVLAVVMCPSVCLSVTSWYCVKMASPRIMQRTPHDGHR